MHVIATRGANARIASQRSMQKHGCAKTHTPPAFAQNSTNEILVARACLSVSHPQRA
jgi:hypothetical protein